MDKHTHLTRQSDWFCAMGLRKLAAQEMARVTGDRLWVKRTWGDRATLQHVLELPERLDKWNGVWLLLSRPAVLRHELRYHRASPAVQDALWVLDWLRENATDPDLRALSFWLQNVHLRTVVAVGAPSRPVSDPVRLQKSLYLLASGMNAAAAGRRFHRWGSQRFDLTLLQRGAGRLSRAWVSTT